MLIPELMHNHCSQVGLILVCQPDLTQVVHLEAVRNHGAETTDADSFCLNRRVAFLPQGKR